MKLFVYGTLKRNFRNNYLLKNSEFTGEATIHGYDIFDLGMFPGIVAAREGEVLGEVFEINKEILKNVDRLEGEGDLYIREKTGAIMVDGTECEVSIYVFNKSIDGMRKIKRAWRYKNAEDD